MISIENEVFNAVYEAVIASYPSAKIESTLNLDPADFPCVYLEEVDNATYTQTIDSGSYENHASVTFELNVYSNKKAGRKAGAKDIFAIADSLLIGWGFSRISRTPATMDDSTKYRIIARYRGLIDKNGIIYRR